MLSKNLFNVLLKKKNNLLLINLETFQSIKNLKHIIKSKYFKSIDGVVIGRSDLAGSMSHPKSFVNSKRIYNIVSKSFSYIRKSKKNKKILKMGGSITQNSKEFIQSLFVNKILDYVETRNIELKINSNVLKNFEQIITAIFHFELEWLRHKHKMQKKRKIKLKNDNLERIKILKKRFQ